MEVAFFWGGFMWVGLLSFDMISGLELFCVCVCSNSNILIRNSASRISASFLVKSCPLINFVKSKIKFRSVSKFNLQLEEAKKQELACCHDSRKF